jgi:hypothetical protein
MLRLLRLGHRSGNDGSSEMLRHDFDTTEGPTGMKILVEPLDPIVEYVLRSTNTDKLLTLAA